jgi:hypothetical protein
VPWNRTHDKDAGIVELRMHGPFALKEHVWVRNDTLAYCREHEVRKILVDLTELQLDPLGPAVGFFEFGESWTTASMPPRMLIACVLPSDAETRQNVELAINAAFNRGFPVREFDAVEEARAWLLEQEP